jgi:TonB-linked SusC/RagA family outer membrane protein
MKRVFSPLTMFGLAMLALLLPRGVEAQNATLTGKVASEFGQNLEGANVYITELAISVPTNATGDFTITIPAARVSGQQVNLRVRAFGYQPQFRPIRVTAGSQTFNFAMKQDVNRLAEVVVTGVTSGTEQKNLAFSVARVDEREMPVPSANPLSQLQGKVPGANIVAGTGRPGAAPAVLLRGPKMMNADGRSQEPLYIVDGVVLTSGIDDINPQDIESVEVVKGAAASSIYGSRAGAGVIQITTKSGRNASGGVRFNARTEYGFADVEGEFRLPNNHVMMMDETRQYFCVRTTNCSQIFDFEAEALRINGEADLQTLNPLGFERDAGIAAAPSQGMLRGTFQSELWPRVYNPIRQLITSGQRTNNTLDASGRFGGTNFFGSINNYWEEGAMVGLRGYTRNSGRLNLDQTVGEDWTFGMRTYYASALFDGRNDDPGGGFFRATRNPVGVNLLRRDAQGRLFVRSNPMSQGDQNFNPVYAFTENGQQENTQNRFLGSLTTRYQPMSWLDLDANFNFDRQDRTMFWRQDRGFRVTTAVTASTSLGSVEQTSGVDESFNTALNATATKMFGDLESRFTARYLYEQQDSEVLEADGDELATAGLKSIRAAKTGRNIDSAFESIASIGYMGGVDLTYKERYILGLVARRDGSSLFGSENRWANYGRASAAWRISEESFWMLPQVNEFKLRASHGTAGGRPRFSAQYESYAVSTSGQLSPSTAGNAALRPETVSETEIGLDAEVLNRFGITANYSHSIAEDQILETTPAAITGFSSQWLNAGTLDNKTIELSVNIPILQRRNLNWSGRVNYDRTKTMITQLDVPPHLAAAVGTNAFFRYEEGLPFATWWGNVFVKDCAQLPTAQAANCGGAGTNEYQANDEGYIVWVGAGNSHTEGITKNLWNAQQASGTGPWSQSLNWGMPILVRDASGSPQQGDLGSALPKYRLGFSNTFNYKKLFAYAQFDGVFGQMIMNQGRQWSLGDFMTSEIDAADKSLGEAKPLGYYWRRQFSAGGLGGFYDVLGPNTRTVEDGSYVKFREMSLSYNVGAVRGVGDFTVGITGRNLMTFTDYTGYDPEVGASSTTAGTNVAGSRAVNGIDNYTFPNLRTFTLSLGTRF